ncbi:permease prefix domain 1-containing protein [Streptomyces platensis]|uniref:permease prefix domain 1-containing protein n=1 Tax=Streptomyces platensis TaxID=58346 RepID=UPI00386A1E1E|nr:permease prefix domain 1-containing protein [Streptomyces platensis]
MSKLHASGTGTLTDRYVAEVVRRIPADQRGDVADELRATIADTVEARSLAGPETAEREVLTEMGDPIRLAARYADRPLALIGPALYPTYVRLLTVLLSTVLPVVTAVTAVLDVLDGQGVGEVIVGAIAAALSAGAQMIAWLTVVFALIERAGAVGRAWTPDDLPDRSVPKKRGAAAYAAVAWHALLIALIVWQHTAQPYRTDGGTRIDLLDPDLWSGWIWPILAGLVGLVTLDAIRAVRVWTRSLAVWSAVAQATFALPLAWVLHRQELFNPAFLSDANGGWQTPDSFYTVAVVGVLAVGVGEVVKRFREARD